MAAKDPPIAVAEQLVGLAKSVHVTPPVQTQWLNCHPDAGEGRFAVAVKLLPQLDADCVYVYVPPHAVIVPGVIVPAKIEGVVKKATGWNNICVVVDREDVCVFVLDCVVEADVKLWAVV